MKNTVIILLFLLISSILLWTIGEEDRYIVPNKRMYGYWIPDTLNQRLVVDDALKDLLAPIDSVRFRYYFCDSTITYFAWSMVHYKNDVDSLVITKEADRNVILIPDTIHQRFRCIEEDKIEINGIEFVKKTNMR